MIFFSFVIDRLKKLNNLDHNFVQYSASFAFIFMHLMDILSKVPFQEVEPMTFELCNTDSY